MQGFETNLAPRHSLKPYHLLNLVARLYNFQSFPTNLHGDLNKFPRIISPWNSPLISMDKSDKFPQILRTFRKQKSLEI